MELGRLNVRAYTYSWANIYAFLSLLAPTLFPLRPSYLNTGFLYSTPDFVLSPSVSTTSVALCYFEHLLLSPRRYIVLSTVNVYLSPPDEGKGNFLETPCLFIVLPVSSQSFLLLHMLFRNWFYHCFPNFHELEDRWWLFVQVLQTCVTCKDWTPVVLSFGHVTSLW